MVGELTVVTGNGFTVIVATAVEEHPSEVPVTVQEVVAAGLAVPVLTPVEVTPALQVEVVAPAAVSVAVCPAQMVGELTVVTGNGLAVTVATAVVEQPSEVPVTV